MARRNTPSPVTTLLPEEYASARAARPAPETVTRASNALKSLISMLKLPSGIEQEAAQVLTALPADRQQQTDTWLTTQALALREVDIDDVLVTFMQETREMVDTLLLYKSFPKHSSLDAEARLLYADIDRLKEIAAPREREMKRLHRERIRMLHECEPQLEIPETFVCLKCATPVDIEEVSAISTDAIFTCPCCAWQATGSYRSHDVQEEITDYNDGYSYAATRSVYGWLGRGDGPQSIPRCATAGFWAKNLSDRQPITKPSEPYLGGETTLKKIQEARAYHRDFQKYMRAVEEYNAKPLPSAREELIRELDIEQYAKNHSPYNMREGCDVRMVPYQDFLNPGTQWFAAYMAKEEQLTEAQQGAPSLLSRISALDGKLSSLHFDARSMKKHVCEISWQRPMTVMQLEMQKRTLKFVEKRVAEAEEKVRAQEAEKAQPNQTLQEVVEEILPTLPPETTAEPAPETQKADAPTSSQLSDLLGKFGMGTAGIAAKKKKT